MSFIHSSKIALRWVEDISEGGIKVVKRLSLMSKPHANSNASFHRVFLQKNNNFSYLCPKNSYVFATFAKNIAKHYGKEPVE